MTKYDDYSKMLKEAAAGSVDAATAKYPNVVSPKDAAALKALGKDDLKKLAEIHDKLRGSMAPTDLAAWQCNGSC